VKVDAQKTAELKIESDHSLDDSFALNSLDSERVDLIVQQKGMTPTLQTAFDRILQQKEKIGAISAQIADCRRESDQISSDQNRVRENMKALKGSSEERALIQRYVGQLDVQESRIATLRKEMAELNDQQNAARVELDRMIMQVNIDESF